MAPQRKRAKVGDHSNHFLLHNLTSHSAMLSSSQVTPPQQTEMVSETVHYTAPDRLASNDLKTLVQSWKVTNHGCAGEECSICLSVFDGSHHEVKLPECGHVFHLDCISYSVEHSKACPICRKLLAEPRGKMPSGQMDVFLSSLKLCNEFERNTIEIKYNIIPGVQKAYHEHPGVRYRGTYRTAYLPNNEDGRKLLKRLKYAFTRGLTFTVGTSLTTGAPNSVTWSSIHHKTSPYGGVYGFPDSSYFLNCNEELDNLGVPSADDLPAAFTSTPNHDSAGQIHTSPRTMDLTLGSISYVVPDDLFSSPIAYGIMPAGNMDVFLAHDGRCRGLDSSYIKIQYHIPDGVQQAYHANPGVLFRGTTRAAYLPYNEQGMKLLKRLKCAFSRGLTFSVGISKSTGRSNVVVWSIIPHKTNPNGGVFGYPDHSYIAACNAALDSVSIPPADQC